MLEINKKITNLKTNDIYNLISVMTPAAAKEYLNDVCEANGEEYSEIDIFGDALPVNGFVFYVCPKNGEGKSFIYDADSKYSNIDVIIREAYEYAYN